MARLPPPPKTCQCTRFSWCAECYRSVERASTESQLRDWLRMWDANGSGPKGQSQVEAE
jgi:hypothetical protein